MKPSLPYIYTSPRDTPRKHEPPPTPPPPPPPAPPPPDHHTRHQRRDVARRGRMRPGKPYMERDDAGFRSKRRQREEEDHVACASRQSRGSGPQVSERRRLTASRDQKEHRQQQHQPEVC